MTLIFTCPETNQTFYSGKFDVVENKGVTSDDRGNKILDAKVKLNEPCPACGKRHVYAAAELACPFAAPETSKRKDHG
jgi:hypothetical protein